MKGYAHGMNFTKVITELARNTACEIQPCHSDEFLSPVKRLAYSVLEKTKFNLTFGVTIPYWIDPLINVLYICYRIKWK